MLHWTLHKQLEGSSKIQKYMTRGYNHVFESLKKLTCYPPDHFVFLQSENEDELVPSFAAAFSNVNPDILASADEDGVMRFFDTRKTLSNGFVSGFEAHDNAIFDIVWAHKEPWLVTASGDQSAVLWDAPTGKMRAVFKQHSGSLKSVSFGFQNNSILATGARDGRILVWDTRCSERAKSHPVPVASITKAHEDKDLSRVKPRWRRGMPKSMLNINPLQSVTAVLFQSDTNILSSGSADGIVKMWDIRTLPRNQKKTPDPYFAYHYGGSSQGKHGFSSLTIDSSRSRFYASCTDGVIYAYDCVGALSDQPAATYSGHINSTFYVKSLLSGDDQFLLSGSSDSNAYIWKINEPDETPISLVGHHGEVTAVAWSPIDKTKIVTCADDCTMRIWRMKYEGMKESELPIGQAKWEKPTSAEDCMDRANSRGTSADQVTESTTGPPADTRKTRNTSSPKEAHKGKFNLKAWATPPNKTITNEEHRGIKEDNGKQERDSDNKENSPITKSDVRINSRSPTTSKTVSKESYCKRRGRRISSLKDWMNKTGPRNSKSENVEVGLNEGGESDLFDGNQRLIDVKGAQNGEKTKSGEGNKVMVAENVKDDKTRLVPTAESDSQCVLGGNQRLIDVKRVQNREKTKSGEESKFAVVEHVKDDQTRLVLMAEETKPNVVSQSNVQKMENKVQRERPSFQISIAGKTEATATARNVKSEKEEDKAPSPVALGACNDECRASPSRTECGSPSLQGKRRVKSQKAIASKRGRGDQIFDYFQPLKRARTDSLPES